MTLYEEILRRTKQFDEKFEKIKEEELNKVRIIFPVPKNHPRAKTITKYYYESLRLEELPEKKEFELTKKHTYLIDEGISKISFIKEFIEQNNIKPIIIKPIESKTKTMSYADEFIKKFLNKEDNTIIAIGGGLLMNFASYTAEKTSSNLILIPSTVMGMADLVGGKVRMNLIKNNKFYKHYYKSFYEPNAMYLEEKFLEGMPEKQIKTGLVEIIKFSLFQSPKLYDYLLRRGTKIIREKQKLKKAIIWNVNLKKICLEVDAEEREEGSRRILRGGHDYSDKIEEEEKLRIPHGIAVAIGIIKQLQTEENEELLEKAKKIFDMLGIPYTLEDYEKWE